MELGDRLKSMAREVDAALDGFLPAENTPPATIHKAMRHSVFAGGKRLRPILTLAAAEACGGTPAEALPAACAVELMHTYSLVHDDLPCMDDDDLRRGRPTCHKVYGEGIAVLAGDALLTAAFQALALLPPRPPYSQAEYVSELALTGGSTKLIGGQVMDLEGEGRDLTGDELAAIHEAKTAALLTCSLRLGAMCAQATESDLSALSTFGHHLGHAFQIIDDILDVTQTTEQLGKTAGKDESTAKATYPAIVGLEASRAEAARLTTLAMEALAPLGARADFLHQIAEYLLRRDY